MMTDAPTGHFQSIVLQPHAGQFVIDELPAIVLCCAAWVYGGMEEQYRIVDFVEHQSLMQQLCGLKTVRIFSMDRNTPRLDLVGIRHNFDVVTLIRERVEYNKRKKGIYEITNH